MGYSNGMLKCDMERDCKATVTHMDEKGYAYCREHGIDRKSYCRTRQLTAAEVNVLKAGGAIYYERARNTPAMLAEQLAKARAAECEVQS